MLIRVRRIALKEEYTIGKLEVFTNSGWETICDTLEDKVRDLNKNGVFDGDEKKVYGETAIPYGMYEIDMNRVSPKFKNRIWGKKYNGIVPHIKDVSEFSYVLIHPLNNASQTHGCIGVGSNNIRGGLTGSIDAYYRFMDNYLIPAKERGEKIEIIVV